MSKVYLIFLCCFNLLFSQEVPKDCLLIVKENHWKMNFVMPVKKSNNAELNDLQAIEKAITNSPFVQGYKYKIDLKYIEKIAPVPSLESLLPLSKTSFLDTDLFPNLNSNLHLNGSVNINGITQLITLKGDLNKYDGKYLLQISYHIGTEQSYLPKIVHQRVQEGLGLILKINLERSK